MMKFEKTNRLQKLGTNCFCYAGSQYQYGRYISNNSRCQVVGVVVVYRTVQNTFVLFFPIPI